MISMDTPSSPRPPVPQPMREPVPLSRPEPRMPVIPPQGGGRSWLYWAGMGLIGVIVLVVIVVLVLYFRNTDRSETQAPAASSASPSPTVTASPTPTPTSTPSPTVVPADWTFEVLNGSEVNGAAAKAAQILRERGYSVKKVDNADKSTYEETQLLVTSERSEAAQALLTDLKTAFPLDEVDATLESTSVTARLIIGTGWQQPTSLPTTSPKGSPTSSPKQ